MKRGNFLAIILSIFIVLIFIAMVQSAANKSRGWASENEVSVSVSGFNGTLQQAIGNGLLKGSSNSVNNILPVLDPGHDFDDVWVSVNGNEQTLRQALASSGGLCGISNPKISYLNKSIKGHYATEVEINVNGEIKSLQDAINDGSISEVGECTPIIPCTSGSQVFTSVGTFGFVIPEGCNQLAVKTWGAGGGGGGDYCGFSGGSGGDGGAGGFANGNLSVTPGETLSVVVGAGGNGRSYSIATDGGNLSGIFRDVIPLIIAGGGGGGGGASQGRSAGYGGAGGGLTGLQGGAGPWAAGGGGGTQTSGGTGTGLSGDTNGKYLKGGARDLTGHSGVGTGGSGYYGGGGGGGGYDGSHAGSGGGGGSSFIPSGGTTLSGNGRIPPKTEDPDYIGNAGYGGMAPGDCVQAGVSGNNGLVIVRWF